MTKGRTSSNLCCRMSDNVHNPNHIANIDTMTDSVCSYSNRENPFYVKVNTVLHSSQTKMQLSTHCIQACSVYYIVHTSPPCSLPSLSCPINHYLRALHFTFFARKICMFVRSFGILQFSKNSSEWIDQISIHSARQYYFKFYTIYINNKYSPAILNVRQRDAHKCAYLRYMQYAQVNVWNYADNIAILNGIAWHTLKFNNVVS